MTERPPNMYPAKLPRPRWGLDFLLLLFLHQGKKRKKGGDAPPYKIRIAISAQASASAKA